MRHHVHALRQQFFFPAYTTYDDFLYDICTYKIEQSYISVIPIFIFCRSKDLQEDITNMSPKKKWTEEGVSPVIATILMVAITVVLAAVLYVMVMGIGGKTENPPAGVIAKTESAGRGAEKLYFGAFNPDTKWDQCKFLVENTTIGAASPTTNTFRLSYSAGVVVCAPEGTTGYSMVGTDLAKDNRINTGDFVVISGLGTGCSYKLTVLYSTGDSVCVKEFNM